MTWKDINVFQYQQIVDAIQIPHPLERKDAFISIVNNWTPNKVFDLSVEQYNQESNKLAFLDTEIEGNPVKYINVNGRRYKCVYDVRKMPSARYLETKVFGTDLINNLHRIAASMVLPMKRTWFGWKVDKYDSTKHEEYAQDMLEANIVDVYSSFVFFYHVYRIWIEVSKDYLKTQMMTKGIQEAGIALDDLLNIMDGSMPPHKLQNTIVSRLAKHINYQP
jgi:hypothetical protein